MKEIRNKRKEKMKEMRNKRKEEIKERKKQKRINEGKKEMKENKRNEGRVGGNQKLNLCMGIKLNLCKKNLHHKSK